MKSKKYIFLLAVVFFAAIIAVFLISQSKQTGASVESREHILRKIGSLGEATTIGEEITVDGYIISGYTAKDGRYGLAVFTPKNRGKYKLQTTTTRNAEELLCILSDINGQAYNFFWANKVDLDYAQVTYSVNAKPDETIKLDIKSNEILCTQAPAGDFSVEYHFVDKSGKIYE